MIEEKSACNGLEEKWAIAELIGYQLDQRAITLTTFSDPDYLHLMKRFVELKSVR